jgi:hypothetical protein
MTYIRNPRERFVWESDGVYNGKYMADDGSLHNSHKEAVEHDYKMANETKQYWIAGIVVEAVKSEGGGFYDITILQTGEKVRYLAEVFETVAKPYTEGK